jgi:hypothetical protein
MTQSERDSYLRSVGIDPYTVPIVVPAPRTPRISGSWGYTSRCARCNQPIGGSSGTKYHDGNAYHPRCAVL